MIYAKKKAAFLSSASVGLLVLAFHGQAFAQGGDGDAKKSDELVLDTITVTADRPDSFGADLVQAGSFRGARQLDTPLTVSVIPAELLDAQQAEGLLDALRNTPGVTSSQTSTTVYNNLDIRGIAVENRTNFRMNGSLPIVNLIDLPLENKARVEALKGASAMYYGFTPPSGIVNLTTKKPETVLFGKVTANSRGGFGGHLDIGDTFGSAGVRANLVYNDVESGIDHTDGNRNFQSLAFQFDPNDALQISIDLEHIYKKVTEPTIVQLTTAATSLPDLVDPKTNPGANYFYATAEEYNALGQIAYDLNDQWNFTVAGGVSRLTRDRRFTRLGNFDPDTGMGRLTLSAADGQIYRNYYYKGEMAGTFATGPFVHEILVGVSQTLRRQYSPRSVGLSGADCTDIGLAATCIQSYYDPIELGPLTNFSAAMAYDPARDTRIDDLGLYAFDRISFGGENGDLINVLIGGRKSFYEVSNVASGTDFQDDPFSFSGGLVIKPQDWLSFYGTYIEGLESSPQPPQAAANFGETIPASKSRQYEGGVKAQVTESLLFTAAYFNIERQLTYLNGSNVFVKDGKATYSGVELSLTGEVNENLSIYATGLFLSAKQGETANIALIDNRIENTAKKNFSLFAEYTFTELLPGFAVNGGVYYVGDRAINPQNSLFIPEYTTLDLGGSYTADIAGKELVFRVNAVNVTGKRYFSSTAGNYLARNAPPMVKFSVSADF